VVGPKRRIIARMAIVAGIDEAGIGPVLGPMVVCASVFEIPDSAADTCLWRLLAPAVSRRAGRKSAAVPVGDSKRLFNRKSKRPLRHLERAVLGMLHTRRRAREPDGFATFADLLRAVAHDAADRAGEYPWYRPGELPLPRCMTATDVTLSGNALAAGMRKAGARLLGIRAEPMFAGGFNRVVRATRNKGTAVIGVTCRLLARLWARLKQGRIVINADRQGGRTLYLPHLERTFEGCRFKIIREDQTCSAYEISDARRTAVVDFRINAEQHHLPVALASMAAKYIRELFMEMFNAFWADRVEGLAPTAGYYVDGRRFFGQIEPAMRDLGIHKDVIYRCR